MLKVLAAVLACLSAAVAITIYTVEVPALKNQINELEIASGTTVTANPTGTATETLTKLDVDGTIYDVESGTTVTANPTGTATETLTKLDVDGTIYEISTESGGGKQLYVHNIVGTYTTCYFTTLIINDTATKFNSTSLYDYLLLKNDTTSKSAIASGEIKYNNVSYIICGIYANGNAIVTVCSQGGATTSVALYPAWTNFTINDTVITL